MPMVSYAQNREDVLLWRLFPRPAGFYIDVGAADPVAHSTTKWFYDAGWTGVNVEPVPAFFARLAADRGRDVNLNAAAADRPGRATLYQVPSSAGWATLDEETAGGYRAAGIAVEPVGVETLTLAGLCERHVTGEIDFLKIDVEGGEAAVLAGADFARWRPRVLVVEATEVGRPVPNHQRWEPAVLAADYRFAAFDGLNRYYVRAEDAADLLPRLAAPANVFDDYVPHDLVREAAARAAAERAVAERDEALRAVRRAYHSALRMLDLTRDQLDAATRPLAG